MLRNGLLMSFIDFSEALANQSKEDPELSIANIISDHSGLNTGCSTTDSVATPQLQGPWFNP